jgi:hypothetical protein
MPGCPLGAVGHSKKVMAVPGDRVPKYRWLPQCVNRFFDQTLPMMQIKNRALGVAHQGDVMDTVIDIRSFKWTSLKACSSLAEW